MGMFGHNHLHGHNHDHDAGDKHDRSSLSRIKRFQIFLKTASYGVMHMTIAIVVAYALSGDWRIALAIGLVEPVIQTIAFFFHEKAWHRFGNRRQAHAHNAITDSTNPLPKLVHPKNGHKH